MSTKVLITVKTYPTISTRYDELVCTAGFREDGTWVRIYPVPFRKLNYSSQYKKYDWIEIDLVKNSKDFRPESYRPTSSDAPPKVVGNISTGKNRDWRERKEIVLKNLVTELAPLIQDSKNKLIATSLAVYKPKEVVDFKWEPVEREWSKEKLEQFKQRNLFETRADGKFEVVKKLPYKFKYHFIDETGTLRKLMIEDWEVGQLYWNCLKRNEGNEDAALEDVRKKYFDDFAVTKDLYFFLGTTQLHQFRSLNPFMIIGTFHPKKVYQQSLF